MTYGRAIAMLPRRNFCRTHSTASRSGRTLRNWQSLRPIYEALRRSEMQSV